MNGPQASIFSDNDDFIDKYLHDKKSFTETGRSVKLSNPLSGDSDTLPNVVAQLIHEYMWAKSQQEFLGNLALKTESPMPDVLAEQVATAVDRFRNAAYYLHKVIIEIHAKNYMDEGLSSKLANRDATINKLRRELRECRAELKEGYKGRVSPLGRGKKDDKTQTGGTEAPVP